MHTKLMEYLESLLPRLKREGFLLVDEKPINYGVQLKFEKQSENIPLSIYYSKKKGISTVIGGSPKNKLRYQLERLLLRPVQGEIEIDHDWQSWTGSDETGKGDFFGPLVAAGFYGKRQILPYLRQIGVMDSKKLSKMQINATARRLYASYFENIKVITMVPATYNKRYQEMKSRGKNLNDLLAWMHARIVVDLFEQHAPEGAIIDKFCSDGKLRAALKPMQKVNFVNKTKAESDLFVAAASIIARYHLNRWHEKVKEELGEDLPFGAGVKVDEAASKLVEKIGHSQMGNYVKLHFNNYKKLI